MELTANEIDSVKYYARALSRYFEERDMPRPANGTLNVHTFASEKEQYDAWLRDSLLWTCEQLLAGRGVYALRGLLQAAGYAGRVGHNATTSDCYLTIRNIFEGAVGRLETLDAANAVGATFKPCPTHTGRACETCDGNGDVLT